jgi:hypothetical protein
MIVRTQVYPAQVGFLHGQLKLLPINSKPGPAVVPIHYISVPIEESCIVEVLKQVNSIVAKKKKDGVEVKV